MEELRGHGPECPTRHDDRAFRTERTSRSDGDGRRNRLEDRELRLNTAAVEKDGFDCFRNAVATNSLGSVSRHETNNQAPENRHSDHEDSEMMAERRHQLARYALVKENVRDESDEFQKAQRD